MFEGFSPDTVDFMWNIRLNNERSWFEAHKDEYLRDFLAPMKALGQEVFARVAAEHDRGFIHKISRIYKDARRLRGGEGPYRDCLWFSIERPSENWVCAPVFWFELSPEHWKYGLGFWPKPETLAKLRARMDKAPKKFETLIAPLARQDEFALDGPEYARKKEAPTPKTAPWYNRKSIMLIHSQPNGEELYSPELVGRIADGIGVLMPFYDYFAAVESDPAPEGP